MILAWFGVALGRPLVLPTKPTPVDGEPFLDVVALHLRLDGQVVDQETLAARYDQVCATGQPLACSWRAWDDRGRVRPAELARLTDPVCGAGDRVVCVAQAWALALGDGSWNGPAPEPAAIRLTAACDQRVRRACTELAELSTARTVDAPDPLALHGYACALGETVGCRRAAAIAPSPEVRAAFEARAGAPPAGEAACAEGYVVACEALLPSVSGTARIETLEQLCHTAGERWCPALAEALVPTEPPLPAFEEPPTEVWFVDDAALIGWSGTTFRDHGLVPYSALGWAELRQTPETVVDGLALVVGAEQEWIVPVSDCAAIRAAATTLVDGGVSVRAVGVHHGPAPSACLDPMGLGPTDIAFHGGKVGVDPRLPDDVGPATDRKSKLDEAAGGLFDCLEAGSAGPEDPLVAQIVHRGGPASKVKQTRSSRDPAFDTCATAWIAATDLGESDVTMKYTVVLDVW